MAANISFETKFGVPFIQKSKEKFENTYDQKETMEDYWHHLGVIIDKLPLTSEAKIKSLKAERKKVKEFLINWR